MACIPARKHLAITTMLPSPYTPPLSHTSFCSCGGPLPPSPSNPPCGPFWKTSPQTFPSCCSPLPTAVPPTCTPPAQRLSSCLLPMGVGCMPWGALGTLHERPFLLPCVMPWCSSHPRPRRRWRHRLRCVLVGVGCVGVGGGFFFIWLGSV